MKKESFVTLRPFMITDLELKGAELIIFAIIYGLNVQDHSFNGSVQYLIDWTRGSRSHTLASLKSLMDKGYIVKEERWDEYKKYCTYNVADYILSENKNEMSENQTGSSENQTDGCLKIRPNNIDTNNIADIKDNNKAIVEMVVSYLNEKTGKKFRPTDSVARLIRGRLKEGYTEEDFRKVIDTKTSQWLKDEKMKKYLQPSTLFAPSHFQNYLNEEGKKEEKPKWQIGTVL